MSFLAPLTSLTKTEICWARLAIPLIRPRQVVAIVSGSICKRQYSFTCVRLSFLFGRCWTSERFQSRIAEGRGCGAGFPYQSEEWMMYSSSVVNHVIVLMHLTRLFFKSPITTYLNPTRYTDVASCSFRVSCKLECESGKKKTCSWPSTREITTPHLNELPARPPHCVFSPPKATLNHGSSPT